MVGDIIYYMILTSESNQMRRYICLFLTLIMLAGLLSGCALCPHIGVHVEGAAEATCSEPGYSGDEICNLCGAVVKKGDVIPTTGHKVEVTGAVAATCTEDGQTGTGVCEVCGARIFSNELIPAEGHKQELVKVAEATCKDDGYTGDLVCVVCGEVSGVATN